MPKLSDDLKKYVKPIEIPDVHALPIINDISYFCKFDELSGVIACPGIRLLSFDKSCFVTRESVFGPMTTEDTPITQDKNNVQLVKKIGSIKPTKK